MVVNTENVMDVMSGIETSSGIKLNNQTRKLRNRFDISHTLGQGTYGKVQMGINKETGEKVAIKTIKKSKIETEADLIRIRREIQIMCSVKHPHIIHIYEVFENKTKIVLVMEIAGGGELYDYLSEKKCLNEDEARRIFRQISKAVYYCHKHNICHRDLKLENILLDDTGMAKIADFGLSNVYDGYNLLNTFCGSPLYASPEIVRGSPYQGPEVDCWSLGVLLYTLVYGAMPFDGSNFRRLVKQITTGDYYEPRNHSTASNLIRIMLTVNTKDRGTIECICAHRWLNQGYEESCLEEAKRLSNASPVKTDLLITFAQDVICDSSSNWQHHTRCDKENPVKIINSKSEQPRSSSDTSSSITFENQESHDESTLSVSEIVQDPKISSYTTIYSCAVPKKSKSLIMNMPNNRRAEQDFIAIYKLAQDNEISIPKISNSHENQAESVQTLNCHKEPLSAIEIDISDAKSKNIDFGMKQVDKIVPKISNLEAVDNNDNILVLNQTQYNNEIMHNTNCLPSWENVSRDIDTELSFKKMNNEPINSIICNTSIDSKTAHIDNNEFPDKQMHSPVTLNKDSICSDQYCEAIKNSKEQIPLHSTLGTNIIEDSSLLVKDLVRNHHKCDILLNDDYDHGYKNAKNNYKGKTETIKEGDYLINADMNLLSNVSSTLTNSNPQNFLNYGPDFDNELLLSKKNNDSFIGPSKSLSNSKMLVESLKNNKPCELNNNILNLDIDLRNKNKNDNIRLSPNNESSSILIDHCDNILEPTYIPHIPENLCINDEQNIQLKNTNSTITVCQFSNSQNKSSNEDSNLNGSIMNIDAPKDENKDAIEQNKVTSSNSSNRFINSFTEIINTNEIIHTDESFERSNADEKNLNKSNKKSLDGLRFEDAEITFPNCGEDKMHSTPNETAKPKGKFFDTAHKVKEECKLQRRDSKVIKAAQFWNKYIGEVLSKSKVCENPKAFEKPKKIHNAGVGEKGWKDLKNAFESGKAMVHEDTFTKTRNSIKKQNLEGCNLGIKVTDAKSAFETKSKLLAPAVTYRRSNSNKPRTTKTWSKPSSIKNDDASKKKVTLCDNELVISNEKLEQNKNEKDSNFVKPLDITLLGTNTSNLTNLTENSHEILNNSAIISTSDVFIPTSSKLQDKSELTVIDETPGISQIEIINDKDVNLKSNLNKSATNSKPNVRKERIKKKIKSDSDQTYAEDSNKNQVKRIKQITEPIKPSLDVKCDFNVNDTLITTESVDNSTTLSKLEDNNVHYNVLDKNAYFKKKNKLEETTKENTNIVVKIKSPHESDECTDETWDNNGDDCKDEFNKKALDNINHEILRKTENETDSDSVSYNLNINTDPLNSINKNKQISKCLADLKLSQTDTHRNEKSQQLSDNSDERRIPIILADRNECISIEPNTIHIPIQLEVANQNDDNIVPIENLSKSDSNNKMKLLDSSCNKLLIRQPQRTACNKNVKSQHKNNRSLNNKNDDNNNDNDENYIKSNSKIKPALFGGLQKYCSLGKHGFENAAMHHHKIRMSRPPFAIEKNESFSSEGDEIDDDGFREMTADNLFSTLLTRVKSLTRRIHDEHDVTINWEQNKHIISHPLNPGGTHARLLERSSNRNSFKRNATNLTTNNQTYYQRNASESAIPDVQSKFDNDSINREEVREFYDGVSTETLPRMGGKRYDARINDNPTNRPGYLPKPHLSSVMEPLCVHETKNKLKMGMPLFNMNYDNIDDLNYINKVEWRKEHNDDLNKINLSTSNFQKLNVNKNQKRFERRPLSFQEKTSEYDEGFVSKSKRRSRFLRPDFYDTPKDESVFTIIKEIKEEDKVKSRFLKVALNRNATKTNAQLERRLSIENLPTYQGDNTLVINKQYLDSDILKIRKTHRKSLPQLNNSQDSLKQKDDQKLLHNAPMQVQVDNNATLVTASSESLPMPSTLNTFKHTDTVNNATSKSVNVSKQKNRPILSYVGARSDGILNQHAIISCNIIAAAERRKLKVTGINNTESHPNSNEPMDNDDTIFVT